MNEEKFNKIYEIVCPMCGKKPTLINKSEWLPTFYCEGCGLSIEVEKTMPLFGSSKYTIKDTKIMNFCKKHLEIYDEDEKCSECKQESSIKIIHKAKFTKEQLECLRFLRTHFYKSEELLDKALKDLKGIQRVKPVGAPRKTRGTKDENKKNNI